MPYSRQCRHADKVDKDKKDIAARKSIFIKLLLGFISAIIVITVFLSVVLNVTNLGTNGTGENNGLYGTVLADIEGINVANPRLVDIAMLGSHDAVTADLNADSPLDPFEKATFIGKIDFMTSGLQYRYGITQTVGLGQQLLQGARFLHIKYTNYDGVWYGTHAHICGTIESHMLDVLKFLDTHPGEIVCLLFQPLYFGDATYASFHDYLDTVRYNDKTIYDYVNYGEVDTFDKGTGGVRVGGLRYNDVTDNGLKAGAVLFDRRDVTIYKASYEGVNTHLSYFDMDACATHVWHSRLGSKVLIQKINETANMISSVDDYDDKIRMNQTQGCMSGKDIFADIGEWSLLKFAQKHNLAMLDNENFDFWLETMPVFQVDYVNCSEGDFNNRVNKKIRDYNVALVADALE